MEKGDATSIAPSVAISIATSLAKTRPALLATSRSASVPAAAKAWAFESKAQREKILETQGRLKSESYLVDDARDTDYIEYSDANGEKTARGKPRDVTVIGGSGSSDRCSGLDKIKCVNGNVSNMPGVVPAKASAYEINRCVCG